MKFAQKDLDTVAQNFGIYLNKFESSSAYKRNSNLIMTDFLFANNFNVKSLLKNWESMLEGDNYTGQDDQSVLSVDRLKSDDDGNLFCITADSAQKIEFVTKGKDKGKVKVLDYVSDTQTTGTTTQTDGTADTTSGTTTGTTTSTTTETTTNTSTGTTTNTTTNPTIDTSNTTTGTTTSSTTGSSGTSTSSSSEVNINDKSKGAWGDPHYETIGKNGNAISFDHQGVAGHTYNVFSGDNISINALYSDYKKVANTRVMTNMSIKIGESSVVWDAKGKPQLDGKTIKIGTTTLSDGSVVKYNGIKLSITPSDGTGVVEIYKRNSSYFDIDPTGRFANLGGILGTAIEQSRALTTAECDAFDVTNKPNLLNAQA